ncbi:hypothetical protein ACIGQE_02330 [Streptomyces sp. NPDC053429]|uniref:hypothetical protein n=1 Tax=unclassified Streptomyces TaxID=2593676 RepID=UPI0033C011A1
MSPTDHPSPRRRRPLLKVAGLLVLLALGGYLVVQYESNGGGGAPHCTAGAPGEQGGSGTYEMSPEQAGNAATIAAVGVAKGVPDRAVTIALATAMQESGLRNLDHGDRDSLGLFQQRPSQGWGTPQEIRDPVYAAGIFYDRLLEVRGWAQLPLTEAAQEVQLSGFPQAYAKHEPNATVLTAAFAGGGSVICGGPAPTGPGRPEQVRAELVRIFGKQVRVDTAGAPAPAKEGAGAPEAEITVGQPQGSAEAAFRRARVVAYWAVAHSGDMGIARVSYASRGWTAGEAQGKWQQERAASSRPGAPQPRTTQADEVRIFVHR